jgi:hypothetical protein
MDAVVAETTDVIAIAKEILKSEVRMTPPPVLDRNKRCKDLAATREVVAATRESAAIGTAVTVMMAAAVAATVTVAASEIEAATVATSVVAAVVDSVVETALKYPLWLQVKKCIFFQIISSSRLLQDTTKSSFTVLSLVFSMVLEKTVLRPSRPLPTNSRVFMVCGYSITSKFIQSPKLSKSLCKLLIVIY